MRRRIPIKNHQQEIQLIGKRSLVGLLFICILILLLIARLGYLQLYKHSIYSTMSTKNWLDLVPIEPTRGLIYDRNGQLLAENIPVFSLDVIPIKVKNLDKTLKDVSQYVALSDGDITSFKRQMKQHRRFDEITMKLRLTEAEVAKFTENQYRFPGIFIKARLIRHYPYGESFSHVIGYVGRINTKELTEIDQINYSASNYIGKSGIEKFYEEALHGNVGYEEVENDASGKPIRILNEIKGSPGRNIFLTIDSNLQLVAERALAGHRGAIVAMDPNSGQVLALVSQPSYDPNIFVTGINQKDYQLLQKSEDKPLFNRAVRGRYPLASTIKPFLALQGLESGTITADDTLYDPGWFQLHGSTHRFHDTQKHGMINLVRAIATSCDTYFYQLANKMGIRLMDDMLTRFGFGAVTGIDLTDELPGIVASPEWKEKLRGTHWYDGDTIISGIGQGFMLATPLQMATATATLAARGIRYTPYLLLGEQTPGLPYQLREATPKDKISIKNNENWDVIIKAMQAAVNSKEGTARQFGRHITYSVAAKTGTGQVVAKRVANEADNQDNIPEKLRDHHLFIAFAPVDSPKIAIAIITENNNSAQHAARIIFDYWLAGSKFGKKT